MINLKRIFIFIFVMMVFNRFLTAAAFGEYSERIEAIIKTGDQLVQQRKYSEALEEYKKALQLDVENPESHYKIGVACYLLEDYDQAVESYKTALKFDPEHVRAINNLALVYEKTDNEIEARILYMQAIEIDPSYTRARYNLGALLIRMDRLDEAKDAIRALLEQDPQYARGYYLLGLIFENEEDYRRAEEMYLKCLSISADFARAAQGLKRVKEQLAAGGKYKQELNKAKKIVDFHLPAGYDFKGVEELVSGIKLIKIQHDDVQDIFIIKYPDAYFVEDMDFEEFLKEEREEFQQFLRDMRITAFEVTGTGEFRPLSELYDEQDGENLNESPLKQAYQKTRKYYQVKCIHNGYDREGAVVIFKMEPQGDNLMLLSLAPLREFERSALRSFYDKMGTTKQDK